MVCKFECLKCGNKFESTNYNVGTIEGEIATCPSCSGISEPYIDTKLYQWVIILTHTDYHCVYVGSYQIEAPTRKEAIEKLKEKIKQTFDGYGDEIEEVYGPFLVKED